MIRKLLPLALACVVVFTAASRATAVTATRITCAATATVVYANTTDQLSRRVLVRNPTDDGVYLGAGNVTSATGFELAAGDAFSTVLEDGDTLYCITGSGTVIVHTFVSRY